MDALQQEFVVDEELPEIVQNTLNKHIANFKQELPNKIKTWKTNFEVLTKLKEIGLYQGDIDFWQIQYYTYIEIIPEQLPLLHKTFGRAKDVGAYELHSAEEETVKVYIDIGIRSHIRLYMIKPLTAYSKCSIVKETKVDCQLICRVE